MEGKKELYLSHAQQLVYLIRCFNTELENDFKIVESYGFLVNRK
jgi:hypothetical protein